MSRWKAAAIHLALSAVIAAALVVTMYAVWYPPPYFTLMGGAMLILLIVGCDVAIGPLITLIIFRVGKKGLKLDLAIIALMQMTALVYGIYMMFEARPVFTVYAVDRFEVVSANEITPEALAQASSPQFASLPTAGPKVVGAALPTDPKERNDLMFAMNRAGQDIKNLPRLYVPYESVIADVKSHAQPIATLESKQPAAKDEIERVIRGLSTPADSLGWVPFADRATDMSMIVDTSSGRMLAVVDASPW